MSPQTTSIMYMLAVAVSWLALVCTSPVFVVFCNLPGILVMVMVKPLYDVFL